MIIKWAMLILMKGTVYREMYLPNQIVEYNGRCGRVIYYDAIKHNVHVLFRTNPNTWKIEKCDVIFCKHIQTFLWGIEVAFCIRNRMRPQTPYLAAVRTNTDYIMEL
jgi:hypothetical protein